MSVFITFEGIDGSGKTRISKIIADILSANYNVYWTKEPTDKSLITELRNWQKKELKNIELVSEENKKRILSVLPEQTTPQQDLLNFLLDRSLHAPVIKAALEEYDIVICDRYHDSTMAYQADAVRQLFGNSEQVGNPDTFGWPVPDLTIFLNILPTCAEGRRLKRDGKKPDTWKPQAIDPQALQEAMERKTDYDAVRRRYLEMATGNDRFATIDANGPLSVVVAECLQAVEELLNKKTNTPETPDSCQTGKED